MSWLDVFRRVGRKAAALQEEIWLDVFGGTASKTGLSVTWANALEVTAVLRCSIVISDTIATVPLKLYQKDLRTGARTEATDHPLSDIVATKRNSWQDALEWRGQKGLHYGLAGNAYDVIVRARGAITGLLPLEPGTVTAERGLDNRPRFKTRDAKGKTIEFGPDEIWHWRGPSWNGFQGLDRVKAIREAIGLAMALEASHARLHKNGVQTSGLYSVEGTLTSDQYKNLLAWVKNKIGGANQGDPLILDRNANFHQTQMTGMHAQHLETRRYQVEEVCRGMGVLPVMAGYTEGTTSYASVEQMLLAHSIHTARPLWRSLEKSADRFLLTSEERREGLYFKFADGELLRGDAKTRGEYYSKALGSGGAPPWMTQNEVREFEELPRRPEEWADELPRGTNPAGSKPASSNGE